MFIQNKRNLYQHLSFSKNERTEKYFDIQDVPKRNAILFCLSSKERNKSHSIDSLLSFSNLSLPSLVMHPFTIELTNESIVDFVEKEIDSRP